METPASDRSPRGTCRAGACRFRPSIRGARAAALTGALLFALVEGRSTMLLGEAPPAAPLAAKERGPTAAPALEPAAGEESLGGAEVTAPPGVQLGKQPETLLEFTVAGGWLMVPISLCSIAWIAFLVERLVMLRRRRVIPSEISQAVATVGRAKPFDRERFGFLIDAHRSAASSILRAALDRLDLPRPEIEHAVNAAAEREIYQLRRNIRIFAIVASVAPLLGLLGTVTGLIQAFREVAIQGLGSGSALAPGIYQALITTAGGLIVAIPSLLTYYGLQARVDHFVHEMDNLVVDFVEAQRVPEPISGAAALGG